MKTILVKRVLAILMAVILTAGLAACGGASEPQAVVETAEQAAETEVLAAAAEETPEQTETPEPTPEPTESPEPTPEPGPYSDPAAFDGFDTICYYNSSAGSTMDVTFGKTTFGELDFTAVDHVMQYDDEVNERLIDPEMLGPGAVAQVITSWQTKLGGVLSYMVYNPSDVPAVVEDCVLVGIMDDEGLQFSNGLHYGSGIDEITALLGEPNEIIPRSQWTFTYVWRDESGEHELTLTVYEPETVGEIDGMSYTNYTVVDR